MKEFWDKLPKAREALPFKRLLEQHGGFCPWCKQQSAYVVEQHEQHGRVEAACIEEVKQRTDLVEFLNGQLELKRSGANYTACCPFHHEKSPSFTVYPKTNSYHCFGCQKSGTAINFVMEREGLSFMAALKKLAERAGVTLRYEVEQTRQYFACLTKDCPSRRQENAERLDELDYLQREGELNRNEALLAFLKQAGVLKEETLPPSILPGQRARQRRTTSQKEDGSLDVPKPEAVAKPAEATPAVEGEAAKPVDTPNAAPGAPATGDVAGSTPAAATPPAAPEKTCTSKQGDAVCGKPARHRHPQFPEGAFCDECKSRAQEFFPNNWQLWSEAPIPTEIKISTEEELATYEKVIVKLRQKIATALGFGKPNQKYEDQLRVVEQAVTAYKAEQLKQKATQKVAAKKKCECDGYEALNDFFEKLTWLESDEHGMFLKRALVSRTQKALGFRSNLASNRELLLAQEQRFQWEELRRSGLHLPEGAGKERRVNVQFCGFGQVARKPKELRDRNRRDDKWVWAFPDQGWCESCRKLVKAKECGKCGGKLKFCNPILIPYFNERGELIKLRPHKGGAPAGTAAGAEHVYVPRANKESGITNRDEYETVVITEGEFKAAALWQTVGDGAELAESFGVCAIPGINFAKSFELREELDGWLTAVRCRQVIVAFDDEEKGDPKLPGYNPDPKKRHDAQIWARYLATDLAQKLHLRGEVCLLPREWRNESGKADWDGALQKITQGL